MKPVFWNKFREDSAKLNPANNYQIETVHYVNYMSSRWSEVELLFEGKLVPVISPVHHINEIMISFYFCARIFQLMLSTNEYFTKYLSFIFDYETFLRLKGKSQSVFNTFVKPLVDLTEKNERKLISIFTFRSEKIL